ncbi:MAG: SCP2 sterol-binding domain-containing protein [Dethiobacteria bacterium]
MPDQDRILAHMLMKAALPLTKTLLEEKPGLAQKYRGWNKVIQFQVKDDPELACHLKFTDGKLDFFVGRHPQPNIDFIFKTPADFNALLTGKIAVPKIKGLVTNAGTLVKFLPLMLGLTLLLPSKVPQDPEQRALKVKLLLYFIAVALSQLNKHGDEDMVNFCKDMPDRVFQWSVQPNGPASYLRIAKGRTKAGKGFYTRRRPFVHMMFRDVDSAFAVLTTQIDNVEAMRQGMLVIDGSPEYGKNISTIMLKINDMVG